MTAYRTCYGCASEKKTCPTRDALKKSLAGLRVTSIKWKCMDRIPRIVRGDPIWAWTIASNDLTDSEEPYHDNFPGTAIRETGAKMLVWIEPGAAGEGHCGDVIFEPKGNGFCKIPLSRLKLRDGDRQDVCRDCDWPTSKGHQPGFICNPHGEMP